MVSEIQEAAVETRSTEIWIPEFGVLDTIDFDQRKKFQGRLYRLTSEACKPLAELIGFTCSFDNPMVRAVYADFSDAEGRLVFDIERNAKPTDLSLRFSRDRWSTVEQSSKEKDALRPWTKTNYFARFIPEQTRESMANLLRLKPEDFEHFYVRINLKDRVVGLIAEDEYIDQFPTGSFQVFAFPEGHAAAIPAVELMAAAAPNAAPAPARPASYSADEGGPKYATYSKSEIDRMLKVQVDTIVNTLSGKFSGQQRSFTEAVDLQEKAFGKISDKMVAQLEETRMKLEQNIRSAHDLSKSELDQFKSELDKELDNFRAHVNKNILPVPKLIDDKIAAFQNGSKAKASSPKQQPAENLKPILWTILAVLLIAVIGSTTFTMGKLSEISDVKAQLTQIQEKVGK
jgi:hypothetical protein